MTDQDERIKQSMSSTYGLTGTSQEGAPVVDWPKPQNTEPITHLQKAEQELGKFVEQTGQEGGQMFYVGLSQSEPETEANQSNSNNMNKSGERHLKSTQDQGRTDSIEKHRASSVQDPDYQLQSEKNEQEESEFPPNESRSKITDPNSQFYDSRGEFESSKAAEESQEFKSERGLESQGQQQIGTNQGQEQAMQTDIYPVGIPFSTQGQQFGTTQGQEQAMQTGVHPAAVSSSTQGHDNNFGQSAEYAPEDKPSPSMTDRAKDKLHQAQEKAVNVKERTKESASSKMTAAKEKAAAMKNTVKGTMSEFVGGESEDLRPGNPAAREE